MKIQNDADKTTIELELSEVTDKMLAFAAEHDVEVIFGVTANVGEYTAHQKLTSEMVTSRVGAIAIIDSVIAYTMLGDLTDYVRNIAKAVVTLIFTDKRIATLFVTRFK